MTILRLQLGSKFVIPIQRSARLSPSARRRAWQQLRQSGEEIEDLPMPPEQNRHARIPRRPTRAGGG